MWATLNRGDNVLDNLSKHNQSCQKHSRGAFKVAETEFCTCYDVPHTLGRIAAEHNVICPMFYALALSLSHHSSIWGPLLSELKVIGTQALSIVTVELKTKMATNPTHRKRLEGDGVRFHHTAQSGVQLKTYHLLLDFSIYYLGPWLTMDNWNKENKTKLNKKRR